MSVSRKFVDSQWWPETDRIVDAGLFMLNGIDAMKDTRGDLTVTSRRTEDGQILITVSDSGCGLPVDGREHLFDAFFTTKP